MKMKRIATVLLLLGGAFIAGCGSGVQGSIGDTNDPEVSGADAEQSDEKSGEVVVSSPE